MALGLWLLASARSRAPDAFARGVPAAWGLWSDSVDGICRFWRAGRALAASGWRPAALLGFPAALAALVPVPNGGKKIFSAALSRLALAWAGASQDSAPDRSWRGPQSLAPPGRFWPALFWRPAFGRRLPVGRVAYKKRFRFQGGRRMRASAPAAENINSTDLEAKRIKRSLMIFLFFLSFFRSFVFSSSAHFHARMHFR